ncbi:hypothetical protein M3202_01925 [Alkalihalobacillus oceani]|uniref:Uncharacterized protein n=1 Tax=Halalkalibacter oceani TaxID=1653776 RepID=A0A9X2DLL5_9BACI|nr:hypothetical protein [Halalkalibacter oceani]MCM3712829.1 hypothetical protein [Halalkalibacter oceani]
MENLLSLIFENIFLVLIIIGGIISFLGRLGGNQNEQQRQKSRPQQQRSGRPQQGQGKIDWREIFQQEEAKPERPRRSTYAGPSGLEEEQPRQTAEVQFESPIAEIEEEQRQLKKRYEEARRRQQRAAEAARSSEQTPQNGQLDLQLNRLSNNEAMKAVVWAEVLGQPRARKPHQTFQRPR